jgi:hypothetical protein
MQCSPQQWNNEAGQHNPPLANFELSVLHLSQTFAGSIRAFVIFCDKQASAQPPQPLPSAGGDNDHRVMCHYSKFLTRRAPLGPSSALNQINDHHDNGNYEQEIDQTAADVDERAQKPEHD